jgi:hypothetical protein
MELDDKEDKMFDRAIGLMLLGGILLTIAFAGGILLLVMNLL